MKRFISIILSLVLVIMPTAFAAPALNTVDVESAGETVVAIEDGAYEMQLNAVTVKPGINMLTGNASMLDAESASASATDITGVFEVGFNKSTVGVVANPDKGDENTSDKVYSMDASAGNSTATNYTYPGLRITLPTPMPSDRPIYTSVKTAKVNNLEHKNGTYFWVLGGHDVSGVATKEVAAFTITTNEGWKGFDSVFSYAVKNADGAVGNITSIKFQHTDYAGNVNPTTFCFDDLGLYPAYKITYYDATGTNVITTDYAIVDENKNIITTYEPKTYVTSSVAYTKWSLTKNGAAVDSIPLNNEDIVLYSVGTAPAIEEISADKYGLGEIGSETVLTAVLGDGVKVDPDKINWSVSGSSVKLTSIARGLSVNAEAVAYGDTVVTAEIDGYKKSVTISVVKPVEITFDSAADVDKIIDKNSVTAQYNNGAVVLTATANGSFKLDVDVDTKFYPYAVIRGKYLGGADSGFCLSGMPVDFACGLDAYNEAVVKLTENDTLDFVLSSGKSVEIDSIILYAEYDSASYLGFDVPATYISAGEAVEIVPVVTSNISHVNSNVEWTVEDEYGVASVDISNGYAIVTPSTGSGVVKLTAALVSDPTVTKSVELYVSDEEADADTVVLVDSSVDSITTDGGKANVSYKVFTKEKDADTSATLTIDNETVAHFVEYTDNGAVVEALANGTVVVTATAVHNPKISASVSVEIKNQRKKYAAYHIRYLATGNSFLNHGPYDGWPWDDPENGNRGMAASRVEYDYFHRTQYHLTNNEEYKADIVSKILAGASFEQYVTTERTADDYLNHLYLSDLQKAFDTFKPNVFTIQLAENIKTTDPAALALFYDTFYGYVYDHKPENCIIVVITPFFNENRTRAVKTAAAKYGFLVNDMSFVSSYNNLPQRQNPYYAFEQYKDAPTVDLFGSHPGDFGMDEIAKGNVKQINSVLKDTLTSEFIYLPEELEIVGPASVTSSTTYTVDSGMDDTDNTVVWSVDNENIATITDDGVLTPVNNGTVVVKAVSVYDSEILDTVTVTVSGQTPCYTVTYDAGADDNTITGIPEKYDYAKGEYVLSNEVPERYGYKFVGWSLTKNGTVTSTVNVTSATTVYAVWAVADNWTFDTEGNFEGIYINAFNLSVKDGVASGISYETGMKISSSNLIINAADYELFKFKAQFTSGENERNLEVKITTTDGTYEYTAVIANQDMNEYVFGVGNLSGTITGFEIEPSMLECAVVIDEIAFVKCPTPSNVMVNTANIVINGNGATYYISNLLVNGGNVILKNGTFVIEKIIGDATAISVENANIITDLEIDGYCSVDLGSKIYESNDRYVQYNGNTYKLAERNNTFGLVSESETLVSVTEKDGVEVVAVSYYLFDKDGATELTDIVNSAKTMPGAGIRVDENTGLRFRASTTVSARNTSENYTVTEYGFIAARADKLAAENAQLNFDFEKTVSGAAYVKENGIVTLDKVYDMSDNMEEIIFTGVLTNIPEKYYTYEISARPYMKVMTANGIHTVYGDVITRSLYDVANAVLADKNNGLTDEEVQILENIVKSSLPDDEIFFPAGDLFN